MTLKRRRVQLEALEPRLVLSAPQPTPYAQLQLPQDGAYTPSAYVASPILADLDGDGSQEIIAPAAGGRLVALKADGNGTPTVWRQYLSGTTANFKATPVVVNLPNGHKGIFASLGRDERNGGSGLGEPGLVFGWDALTGQVLPGWPQSQGRIALNQYQAGTFGPLASGDLDGDGVPEIVVGSHSTFLSAFKLDGTLLWRFEHNDTIETGAVIADIDGDGKNEVVYANGISKSFVPDGGLVTVLNGINGTARSRTFIPEVFQGSPVLADLNGDGKLEIIVGGGTQFGPKGNLAAQAAGNRVYAFDFQGHLLPGWPYHTTTNDALNRQSYASPAVADLLGNFQIEVVDLDQSGVLHVIQPNGQPLPGWEGGRPAFGTPDDDPNGVAKAFASPIIADIDGDGMPDIVVAKGVQVAAFNRFGTRIFSYSPAAPGQAPEFITATPAVGQFDGKGGQELVILSNANNPDPNNQGRPSLVSLFHLDPSPLVPPWPMMRRDASATAVRRSVPYLAGFVNGAYKALLGRTPNSTEFLGAIYGMEANQYPPAQFARYLSHTNDARGHVVDQMYRQFLDRAPAPAERAYLATVLATSRQRDVALVLVNTPEFIQKGGSVVGVIDRLYQRILGRAPRPDEVAGAIGLAQQAHSLVPIGDVLLNTNEAIVRQAQAIYQAAFGSATVPIDSQAALASDIRRGVREEDADAAILASHGNYAETNTLASFIRTLYRDLVYREAQPAETANLIRLVETGSLGLDGIARYLIYSPEGRARFVQEKTIALLGHPADPGLVAALQNYGRRQDVVAALASSDEYFFRNGGTVQGFVRAAYRDLIGVDNFDQLAPADFNSWVQRISTGTPRSTLVGQLVGTPAYFNPIVVEDYYRYLPDEFLGFLRTGPLPINAPGQPINPDPAGVAAFVNALQNGAREEDVIVALVTTPKYVTSAAYDKGYYITRGLRS